MTLHIFGTSGDSGLSMNGSGSTEQTAVPDELVELAEFADTVINPEYLQGFLNASTPEERTAMRNKIISDKTIDGSDLDYNIRIQKLLDFYNTGIENVTSFANLAIQSLGVVNLGTTQYSTITNLENQVSSLQNTIDILQEDIPTARNSVMLTAESTVESSLDMTYLQYVVKYGYPANGVFDPILLAEFL